MEFLSKNWFSEKFDTKAENENDTNNFFKMYGSYYYILFSIYWVVVSLGVFTDFKVSNSILYNLTGDPLQALIGALLFTAIVHLILVFVVKMFAKIRVNKLHKKDAHKFIYYTTGALTFFALATSITLNYFADGWTDAEVKKQTEIAADNIDKKATEAEQRTTTLLKSKEELLEQEKRELTRIYNDKITAVRNKAAANKETYNRDKKQTWALRLAEKELSKIPDLENELLNKISEKRKAIFGEVQEDKKQLAGAIFASFGLREKLIKQTEKNQSKNTWFLRITSTLLQLIGIVITFKLVLIIKNGNETRKNKPAKTQTEVEQLVLQYVQDDGNGNWKIDNKLQARIRKAYERRNKQGGTDYQAFFKWSEHYLKRYNFEIEILDDKRIKFNKI